MPPKLLRPAFAMRLNCLISCLIGLFLPFGLIAGGPSAELTDGPSADIKGEIVYRGVIDCFEPGLLSQAGVLVNCEASAITFTGDQLVLASDKPIPGDGKSAVFSISYPGKGQITGQPRYFGTEQFIAAEKYEDMTITPDGAYIIATTGFDRIKSDSNEWDGFNTLLAWPLNDPTRVQVVEPSNNDGVISSVKLRDKISRALVYDEFPDEVPYFKVESLAAIPGDQLLFGIRELGVRYDQFVYTFKIISTSYEFTNGVLSLGEFKLVYDFDTNVLIDSGLSGSQPSPALSSIEYDAYHKRLYLLTSYETEETDEGLGGYLWTLPLSGLNTNMAPAPVRTRNGELLHFAHKAEGITILNENLLLIIHDDDRVLGRDVVENPNTQFSRQAHQAAYSLLSID
ncbi:MAG: hypothetical protein ACI8ZT_001966 [Bacteroidia bacterium]|jgi:hypothetical protein